MRIRYKKWARPELEASKFYIDNPEELKGKWKEYFKNPNNPIHLELGCGKGQFISNLASENLNINYIAIDLIDAMLGLAKRNVEKMYNEKNLEPNNILLTRFDIERILLILNKEDDIKRIYINFCNPWPKGKHRKKRLTHTRQLEKYNEFLSKNGEIYFKTDDDDLFNSTLNYLVESGFEVIKKTYNLHEEPIFENNIETEHEKMFSNQGIKIKALIAKLKETVELQEFYTQKEDADNIKNMDSAFHRLIYYMTGSTPVYDTLVPLHKRIIKYRKASVSHSSRAQDSLKEHKAIYEAIAARDSELAEKLLNEHLKKALDNITKKEM